MEKSKLEEVYAFDENDYLVLVDRNKIIDKEVKEDE